MTETEPRFEGIETITCFCFGFFRFLTETEPRFEGIETCSLNIIVNFLKTTETEPRFEGIETTFQVSKRFLSMRRRQSPDLRGLRLTDSNSINELLFKDGDRAPI